MVMNDDPGYNLVEFSAPKQVKRFGNREYVAYGYTYKKGLAEDTANAARRCNMSTRVTHDSSGMDILWIGKEKNAPRSETCIQRPLTVKRFKITPVKGSPGFYWISAGRIGNTFYPKTRVAGKAHAQDIVDARHRMMMKKSTRISTARKELRQV